MNSTMYATNMKKLKFVGNISRLKNRGRGRLLLLLLLVSAAILLLLLLLLRHSQHLLFLM